MNTSTSLRLPLCMLTFLMLGYITSTAQVLQPNRYERQQKNSDDYFNVISLKKEGLALFRERDKFKGSSRIWELIFLDTALQEKKTLELEIRERHKMIGYEVTPGKLYLLFRTGETTKNDLELIPVSISEGAQERHVISPDLDFKLTHFCTLEKSFVFGGYVNNDPAVILYDLETKRSKVVPGFFQKDTELVDLRVNQNNTFNVVLVNRSTKGERNLTFRTFDGNGEMLLEDTVPLEDNRTIQTGITSTLEREDLMIMGTWGEQRNAKYSNGFFSMSVDPFSEQKINFISFGELNNYLAYINPKRVARIKEATKQDLEANRTPNFTSNAMPYRIHETKQGFLMLAEVYQPNSSSGTYSNPYYYNPYYSPYGMYPYGMGNYYYPGMNRMYRPYNYGSNVRNNEEIKSEETVLIMFNSAGKVMWDYSLVFDDVKMPSVEQVSDFNIDDKKINLIYKKESELKVKTIVLGEGTETELLQKLNSNDPLDIIKDEKNGEGGVRNWYGNTYYVYGYQTLRNLTKEERTREVFYINKVVVH